jgi:hypothetical protein
VGEEAVDPPVSGDVLDEVVGDSQDGIVASEPIVERRLRACAGARDRACKNRCRKAARPVLAFMIVLLRVCTSQNNDESRGDPSRVDRWRSEAAP